MTKIIILYTDAGGGHKSAALTLKDIIQAKTDWQVELINPYKELCAEFDLVKRIFGISAEDLYNRYVSENRSALLKFLIISGFFKVNLALSRSKIVRKLTGAWLQYKPAMVISVTPFINQIVADSITQLPNPIPFVTYVTDYQECWKYVWITKKEQKLICCSDQLVQRALSFGMPAHNLYKLSGMLVAYKFYAARKQDRAALSAKLGLQQNIPTVLVTFGSHGSDDMLIIAKNMRNCNYKVQMIFICGHDAKLKQTLENLSVDYPFIVTDFVNNLEEYMRCTDVFIGKPGGLSISEAALMHLPLIIKFNFFTLLQERHNAKWVIKNNIGITVKNFKNIQATVQEVLDLSTTYVEKLNALENRAYEQLLPILEKIFEGSCIVSNHADLLCVAD